MPAEITQDNVRLLIPGKAARMATLIAAHRHITPKEALLAFYRSRTYRDLERESSKYWHYSPEQLFAVSGFSRRPDTGRKHGRGRSILAPFQDEILAAWNNRQSAREITERLALRGVRTTPQNVWKFIRRQSALQTAEI